MQTFSISDLRDRNGALARAAKAGELVVISSQDQPVCIAVPFDETLVRHGVNVALAIKLVTEDVVNLGQGAKLAGMSDSEFIDLLGVLQPGLHC